MTWEEIRNHYPHQWLLVEAIQAHSEAGMRIVEQLAVLDTFADSTEAIETYSKRHREMPQREFYVLHTDRPELNIHERKWVGVRRF